MIADARRTVRRERRRTIDEREAFDAFADAVRELSADGPPAGVRVGARFATPDATGTTAAVRAAYERTVMAVPHYREEYDDSYRESLAAEFNPTVAAGVTGSRLTDAARSALLEAAENARADRARFVDALDHEDEMLRTADKRLGEPLAELRFGSLDGIRARLGVLDDHVEAVAADRQAGLRQQHADLELPADVPDLQTYVYQDAETTYPVLSTAGRTAAVLERIRSDVERAMARV